MKGVILGLFLAIGFASAQNTVCAPGQVQTISFDSDYILSWSEVLNPNDCVISNYIINIIDGEDGSQFQVRVPGTNLSTNLGSLTMCKAYTFEVRALSSTNVLGPLSDQYSTTTLPKSNPDLTLVWVTANATEDKIDLTWQMSHEEIGRCISYFRVTYWDESNQPLDIYTMDYIFTLEKAVPCMTYRFQVAAMITSPNIQGAIHDTSAVGLPKVPESPTLVRLRTTTSTANIEWRLQPYTENRCALIGMDVYTIGAPEEISAFQIPITDNILRPNLNVTLTSLPSFAVFFSYVNVVSEIGTSETMAITFATVDEEIL